MPGMTPRELARHRLSQQQIASTKFRTPGQLVSWLGAINDLRLVLGTKLDVTEETYERQMPEDDPNAPGLALYFYLGWLEEQIVEALAGGLDPAGTQPGGGSDQAPTG